MGGIQPRNLRAYIYKVYYFFVSKKNKINQCSIVFFFFKKKYICTFMYTFAHPIVAVLAVPLESHLSHATKIHFVHLGEFEYFE